VLPPDVVCHRIGGGESSNLHLRPIEESLDPPGISVFIGGAPSRAASDIRRVFGSRSSLGKKAATVGTATIADIQVVGFDVIEDASNHFPNHGRLIRPNEGVAGFTQENLEKLAAVFVNHTGL
jgi:hypothetical protein